MRIRHQSMQTIFFTFFALTALSIYAQESQSGNIIYNNSMYPLYPETITKLPVIPSPLILENGIEVITAITKENRYQLIPVKVENGDPLNYEDRQWYVKGLQLVVDTTDFPTLAVTGLHSENELKQATTITGIPVADITSIGRPGSYSGAGFMADDEDIISVLTGDNRLVEQLGLTHPELSVPMFHLFNVIITIKTDSDRGNISAILYNGKRVDVKFRGYKGWQESIFNDEILGYWEIEMSRDPDKYEMEYLAEKYKELSDEQMSVMIKKLSHIHTGEMVPFYIKRYGFYEGHTDYRADPIALSFVFGLKTIEEIESSFEGSLYKALTEHFNY